RPSKSEKARSTPRSTGLFPSPKLLLLRHTGRIPVERNRRRVELPDCVLAEDITTVPHTLSLHGEMRQTVVVHDVQPNDTDTHQHRHRHPKHPPHQQYVKRIVTQPSPLPRGEFRHYRIGEMIRHPSAGPHRRLHHHKHPLSSVLLELTRVARPHMRRHH